MKKAGLATPLLHGIIMIESDCEFSQLTYDKQDLAHENFLDFIREDITQAYLDWDGIEETEVLSEE
jgi:fructose-1,6-bisphosphatase